MPTLRQLVSNWRNERQSGLDAELDYYLPQRRSAVEAIRLAAMGRGEGDVKLDHQRRLNLIALDTFAAQLVAASHY